jgi:hypothetical protein
VALLISCIYIKAPESDITIDEEGKIKNAFEERQKRRKQMKKQKGKEKKLKQVLAQQRAAQNKLRKKHNVPKKKKNEAPVGASKYFQKKKKNEATLGADKYFKSHRGPTMV